LGASDALNHTRFRLGIGFTSRRPTPSELFFYARQASASMQRNGTSQRYPEPTVGALILNSAGRMLLVKSHKWGDRYTIAGGHVEVGETLVEALKREIREEVGLRISDVRLLMTQEAIFSPEFYRRRHFIFFDFVCRCDDDNVVVDGDEIQSYLWEEPREALGKTLDSFTRRMVERFLGLSGD